MATTQSDDELIANINVTPFVDVVLVLLAIFMITAPVIYQSAIKVELPSAKSGKEGQASKLSFTLTKAGELFWGKESLSWEALAERLTSLDKSTASETAIINADQSTEHGKVVRHMDVLREAGLTRFSLSVNSIQ